MIYTKAQILADVRKVMNENASSLELTSLLDTETLDLDAIILSTICDAARAIESGAPLHTIDYCKELLQSAEIIDGRVAKIELPTDFMRMVAVRWPQLQRPIYKFISVDSPEYLIQQNKYVQGTIERPVAAVLTRNGTHILEVYAEGITEENIPSYIGEYLPIPAFNGDEIELCERCYKAIIYRCAGMAMVILQDNNADNLLKICESMLI